MTLLAIPGAILVMVLAAMEHPELKTVFYRAAMVQIAEARWIRVSGCGGLQNRLPS